jgi:hypothetical protein
MNAIHWIIAAAALSFVQPAPASAAITDPEVIIYRFPGVRDNGGADNTGVATSFHCTNFSGGTENIRFVTRDLDGTLKSNHLVQFVHLATITVSTHATNAYNESGGSMSTGTVAQGTTAIAATSINITCTAETIDASNAFPMGVARRGIRFRPVPGSQE